MLCILKTPIDLAMWVKLHYLITNRKGTRNGVTAVDILDRSDFAAMVPNEKLILVSHGSETEFGGMTPAEPAKQLITRNFRYDVRSIKLSGCKAGSDKSGTPYALQLALELYRQTKHCRPPLTTDVTAFIDTAVTLPTGKVRTKDTKALPKKGPGYTEIIDKYKKSDPLNSSAFDFWVGVAARMPYGDQSEIIASAEHMARISKNMFDELFTLNNQIILDKEASKYKVRWN